jgi:hypothetical protein
MITSHRRTLLVWSPMLVMLALSAVFAEVVVPGLITRVYDGCGPAVLARLMPRRDLHDVGYYVVKTRKLVREELMLLSLLLFAYTAYRTGWLKRAATSLVEFGSKGTDLPLQALRRSMTIASGVPCYFVARCSLSC